MSPYRLFSPLRGDGDGGAGDAEMASDIDAAVAVGKSEVTDDAPCLCDPRPAGLRHQLRHRKIKRAAHTVDDLRQRYLRRCRPRTCLAKQLLHEIGAAQNPRIPQRTFLSNLQRPLPPLRCGADQIAPRPQGDAVPDEHAVMPASIVDRFAKARQDVVGHLPLKIPLPMSTAWPHQG